MKNYFLLVLTLLLFFSCSVEPKEIIYGTDHCGFCDMTVMDKSFASEYVTKKGKCTVFDASECMLHSLAEKKNEADLAFVLVANYGNPGELIDANTATFLVSKNVKSPMGGNLSAHSSLEAAEVIQAEKGGELYSWEEMKTKYSK